MSQKPIAKRVFSLSGKLTFIFFVLQIWIAVMHIVQPIPMSNLVVSFSKLIIHSWVIIGGFLFYVFAQLLLYTSYAFITGGVSLLAGKFLRFSESRILRFSAIVWTLATLTILLLNQYYFHWSVFSVLIETPARLFKLKLILIALSTILFIVLGLAMARVVQLVINRTIKPIVLTIIGIFIIGTPLLITAKNHSQSHIFKQNKPNIIIIGIDSLRPDFTSMNGPLDKAISNTTPHVDNYLQQAAIFDNAFTPLARTFPAWMSILTGENPKVDGVRVELPDLTHINAQNTLGNILRKAGYTTIFSSDDRRFNHIVPELGFDEVIAPATGFNDFILGAFNDFPLSNLIMNTRFGQWLFPYSYANRSADITYLPNTYLKFLNEGLETVNQRPLFLAIHLTLPHWPFIWANSQRPYTNSPVRRDQLFYSYGVARADKQFAGLLNILKQQHLLDNAFVILMSDHGQSLGFNNERSTGIQGYLPGNKKIPQKTFNFLTGMTFGHGTDVLNYSQYHIVFAIRGFGLQQKFNTGKIYQVASLIDIKPTILSFLNLPVSNVQGISLLPWLTKPNYPMTMGRDLYAETGFTLPGILVADPNVKKALQQGMSYFTIEPKSGSIVIKPELIKLIVAGKQRAIINYPWQLTCYPLELNHWTLTLSNLVSHQWTTDLNSPLASKANAKQMLTKLQQFYGNELKCG